MEIPWDCSFAHLFIGRQWLSQMTFLKKWKHRFYHSTAVPNSCLTDFGYDINVCWMKTKKALYKNLMENLDSYDVWYPESQVFLIQGRSYYLHFTRYIIVVKWVKLRSPARELGPKISFFFSQKFKTVVKKCQSPK